MKYEHLIEINDPALLTLAPLSRSDLWQGLMLRVEQPMLFLPHLEQMQVVARDDSAEFGRSGVLMPENGNAKLRRGTCGFVTAWYCNCWIASRLK